MRPMRHALSIAGLALATVGVAAAQPEDGDGGLLELLFSPFLRMAQALIDQLVTIMFTTPTIHPNPPVTEIHRLTLGVAVVFSILVVAATGFAMITGTELAISYEELRAVLPRLLLALGFALVALPALQWAIDLSDALVEAFRPTEPALALEQLAGLTTSLVLVWFINAWLLLALTIVFLVRSAYLAFVAAAAPLVALAWAFPFTRPYAESFIAGWFALLVIAPIDALVLRFNLAMLRGSGALGLQPVSNWVLGVGSFVLMLWIPYQLWGVAQSMVGRSTGLAGDIGESARRRRPPGGSGGSDEPGDEELQRQRRDRRRRDRDRRRRW